MKTIKGIIIATFALLGMTACDTTEEDMIDNSYVKFGIKLVFQAETTDVYKFTLDGDTIKVSETYYYPSKKTTATLRAYKNNESTPALEENVAIERPEKVVKLIQMPGADISILSGKGEEEDPSSENKVKLRLFYNNVEGFGKAIKVDVWIKVGRRGTPVFTNVSFELEEGKLSDYKEIDLNYLFPDQTGSPKFITDIWDAKTGALLIDHSAYEAQINLGYTYDPNYGTDNGFKNDYKHVTSQLFYYSEYEKTLFEPLHGLCVAW